MAIRDGLRGGVFRNMQHRDFLRALPAGALAALVTTAALAQATIRFDLPAQTLEASLRAIGKSSDINILIDRKLVAALQAPALKADLSVAQAMSRLLEGTGLTYQYVNEHTIVLATVAAKTSNAGSSPSATSKPTTDARSNGSNGLHLAQAGTQSAPSIGNAEDAPSGGVAEQRIELQEVVVTAQKRTESAQNVPLSVSVIDSKLIENLHANSLTDLGGYVPGLQVTSGGTPGQATLSIRGITPLGGGGATVGTYIDDAPLGGSSAYARVASYALDLLPYDVQRVEVLRGPQGTLYGASSLGGLLKYVLNTPNLESFEARVGGDLSNVDNAANAGGGARAWINAPLIQGQLGMIASYAYEHTPGYIDNTLTGTSDQNSLDQQSGRLALLWEPTDDLALHLGALYQKIDSTGNATVALSPTTLRPLAGDLTDDNYVEQAFDKEIGYYTATLNWRLGWSDFTSATSYSRSVQTQAIDNTRVYGALLPVLGYPAGGVTPFDLELSLSKVTQEFRLASSTGGPVDWLVGTFYTHEGSANSQVVTASSFTGQPLPAKFNPLAILELPSTYKEYALFGNSTWHIDSRFDLSGGLRYARNEQSFSQIGLGGLLVGNSDVPGSSAEDVLTYSVSPAVHLTKDIMAYARVATGYQPGGPNFALPGVPSTFKSDRTTNYEVGLKSTFWDNRVMFDMDAFYIDWKDIQVSVYNPTGISYFANGGTAKSEGAEATLSANPVTGLILGLTFAYTEAELTQNVPSLHGVSGDSLPNIPRFSGSLQADYSHRLTAEWTGHILTGLRLQDSRLSDFPAAKDSFRLPGYGALDLGTNVDNGRYTLRLFVKNLTDRRAYLNYSPIYNGLTGAVEQLEGTVLQPRTVGLSADVRF
jgi:outer membrane receptor protein involved in Fe transport